MTLDNMVNAFSKLRPSATFLSVKEYHNKHDEISNFGVVFHIDYKAALKRSYKVAANYQATDMIQREAKRLVLSSLEDRIAAFDTPLEERDSPYVYFKDATNQYIKGIKAHVDTNDLFMFGLLVSKNVLKAGNYKHINSSRLTIAKNNILKTTPVSKFRQFRLLPKSYKEIKVENLCV
jgi:hypothetical protein